jgi:hypothetical protein
MNKKIENLTTLYQGFFIVSLFFITSFLFFLVLISNIHFFLSQSLDSTILPLGGVLSVFSTIFIFKNNISNKKIISFLIVNIILIYILSFIAGMYYDTSWDGRSYHQSAILSLMNGWNPIYNNIGNHNEWYQMWENVYPKATWILAANFNFYIGNIEESKVINFIFLLLAGYSTFIFIRLFFVKGLVKSTIYTLVIIFNPVVIQQLFTYYVDGILYHLLISSMFLMFIIFKYRDKTPTVIFYLLVMVFVLLFNIKFTGLAYAIIITSVFFGVLLIYRQFSLIKRLFNYAIITLVLGFVICGFNPYVKNLLNERHIFFPLMGEQKIEFTSNKPEFMRDNNRFENLFLSVFSKTLNSTQEQPSSIGFFNFSEDDWDEMKYDDVRIGGFGLFFGYILILSLLYIILSHPKKLNKYSTLLISMIFFTIILNSESWWSRYAPQLWLMPIILLLSYQRQEKLLLNKIVEIIVIGMFVLTIFLTFNAVIERVSYFSNIFTNKLSILKSRNNNFIKFDSNYIFSKSLLNLFVEKEVSVERYNNFKGYLKEDMSVDLRGISGAEIYIPYNKELKRAEIEFNNKEYNNSIPYYQNGFKKLYGDAYLSNINYLFNEIYHFAFALQSMGKNSQALNIYKYLENHSEVDFLVRLNRISILLELDKWQLADKDLKYLEKHYADKVHLFEGQKNNILAYPIVKYLKQAEKEFIQGNYLKSKELFAKVLSADSFNIYPVEAYHYGYSLQIANEVSKALEVYSYLDTNKAIGFWVRLNRMTLYLKLKKLDLAKKDLEYLEKYYTHQQKHFNEQRKKLRGEL